MHATKDRIVIATAELFRHQGYAATGMKQVVAGAGAPFGSLYHFFPGGKEELGAETIRRSGRDYGRIAGAVFTEGKDVVTATHDFYAGAAAHLVESGYADACPIATVALEVSSHSEPLRSACAEVFEEWIAGLSRPFAAAGLSEPAAREIAVAMLCALEGAFVLARALRTTEPLEVAGVTMVAAVQRALAAA